MRMNYAFDPSKKGFTLLETLIVLLIIGLLILFGAPAYTESVRYQQLKSALQGTYFLLKTARMMSIHHNQDISVQFEAKDNWCVALSNNDRCNCQLQNDCTVQGQSYSLKQADFPTVALHNLKMGKLKTVVFDRHRGISVGKGGSGEFVASDMAGKFIISNLGRVRICMSKGTMGGYPPC